MSRRQRRAAPWVVLLALLLTTPAGAANRDEVAFARATSLARAGQCPDALAALAEMQTTTAASAHLRGQCQLEAHDYPAALASLEEAKRLDPSLPDLELHLGVTRFHMGDTAGAREALDTAAPTAQDHPQYHLYLGLVLLQEARSAEAAAELARARSLGPGIDPGASYYEGVAWAGAEEREKAAEALERVERDAPGTIWAQQAARARRDLDRSRADARGRVWAFARGGFEYDDNVALRAAGVDLPETLGSNHDVRGVLLLHSGVELLRGDDWAAGVQGTYYGSAHFDLSEFNQHYPVLGVWLDKRLGEDTVGRVTYDAGYAWVDADPFVFTQELRPSVYHDFGEAGRTELFASFYKYNFLYGLNDVPDGGMTGDTCSPIGALCGPDGINENRVRNRDGWGLAAGFEHTYSIEPIDTDLYGGASYLRYSARGEDYSFQGVATWLGSETALPWELFLRLQVGFAYLPYRHPSSFPDPGAPGLPPKNQTNPPTIDTQVYPLSDIDRNDNRWTYVVELEKVLNESFSASLRWSYIENDSNAGVFAYDREVTGVYVTYRLAR